MKYISPAQLFNEQLATIGQNRSQVILQNLIDAERVFQHVVRYLNVRNLSMIIKVKNSQYSIKYTYNNKDQQLIANKLLLIK